ncbi:hypothetical protein TNCT_497331 [Trichonephila clavata]|uniref:Uncharacterized protein n=1 Tax=Trichonephila clavata TaxID=2740835 RepID=A0A8X6HCU4_TRICU|nr:hypothetical protein TNCT_497331 [Trichonephila clavata]
MDELVLSSDSMGMQEFNDVLSSIPREWMSSMTFFHPIPRNDEFNDVLSSDSTGMDEFNDVLSSDSTGMDEFNDVLSSDSTGGRNSMSGFNRVIVVRKIYLYSFIRLHGQVSHFTRFHGRQQFHE